MQKQERKHTYVCTASLVRTKSNGYSRACTTMVVNATAATCSPSNTYAWFRVGALGAQARAGTVYSELQGGGEV